MPLLDARLGRMPTAAAAALPAARAGCEAQLRRCGASAAVSHVNVHSVAKLSTAEPPWTASSACRTSRGGMVGARRGPLEIRLFRGNKALT
eukprot:scaffold2135_cov341-Prasinococcus_capsulatus_cf.AAC.7